MVSFIMALRGLNANKLRSFLTTLGMIMGVGAVIIAISIGQGSKQAVAESTQALGTNTLTILPGQQKKGGVSFGFGSIKTMKLGDADALLKQCPSVQRVSPTVSGSLQVKYKNKNSTVSIQGNGEDYPVINNHKLKSGRYFNAGEIKGLKRVCILGATTAKDLFDQQNPVGKRVKIKGIMFEVIGLFKAKGGLGFRNPDDAVYVPVTTGMRRLFGLDYLQAITMQARSDSLMNKAQDEIDKVMRSRHKITSSGTPDWIVFNQADLQATQQEQQDTFLALIAGIAVISLLVGGIGIMNIMLVSVTERTREIGVRKAIGAKRRNILAQFLMEALFLSLIGGLLGVVFGIAGSNFVGNLNSWRIVIDPSTVILAFSFSAFVGIFFGFYPALKASKLNPIDALRYE
ncbi:MAG: ABC transporter permease [Chthonomonadales bacterium]